jgi:hypothetical protein
MEGDWTRCIELIAEERSHGEYVGTTDHDRRIRGTDRALAYRAAAKYPAMLAHGTSASLKPLGNS